MPPPTPQTKLAGVLPVLQTPYHDDETIDYDTLAVEIDWLFQAGADGVVIAMVSEILRLSLDERRQLAEFVCQSVGDRGSVVVSVGAESSTLADGLARHAESVGATAVMAIPPIGVGLSDDQLLHYYERLLGVISIPVIVQDASGYVGKPMSIAVQAWMLDSFGDRVLFKPEAVPIGPRLTALRDATSGRAKIYEGSGGIALVDSYRRGIFGTMPGSDLIDAIVALWKALERGDEQRLYEISLPLSSLVGIQHNLDAFLAVEKHLLCRRGIFKNEHVRGPVGYRLDEETRSEINRLFDLLTSVLGKEAAAPPRAAPHTRGPVGRLDLDTLCRGEAEDIVC